MKYKILNWELGETTITKYPCIMAVVECTPGWISRNIFKKPTFKVDCYWDDKQSWHDATTGKVIEQTTYVNYDSYGAWRRLGDFLEKHRDNLTKQRQANLMIRKIQMTKKI